eukprot:CAMPEP_0116933946 /NCGR_PEP_ID=MMETSP0467-20121206/29349_1 /TAXON_ID=283647 /ORGANISM="Mesodinium pulex, Strain SPMC105" /LENGTH=85 /DNA_ID=CAMNT_0004614943 /DNA_START=698 /DNA_END=955 /DNA_ORIENTATION=+
MVINNLDGDIHEDNPLEFTRLDQSNLSNDLESSQLNLFRNKSKDSHNYDSNSGIKQNNNSFIEINKRVKKIEETYSKRDKSTNEQ